MAVAQEKIDEIAARFEFLAPYLNERLRRLWAGAEAAAIGHGGVNAVVQATSMGVQSVREGRNEVTDPNASKTPPPTGAIRRPGAGRPRAEQKNPALVGALLELVKVTTQGEPQAPLCWTCKSTRQLAEQLTTMGHPVGHNKIHQLLVEHGFSLRAARKPQEGTEHPERDTQFRYINELTRDFLSQGNPVLALDLKKKVLETTTNELPKVGQSESEIKMIFNETHGLPLDEGWIHVGITPSLTTFVSQTILVWWSTMGRQIFNRKERLLLVVDSGEVGSNRSRALKWEVQRLSDELNMQVKVAHYPLGTTKWNKVDHRFHNRINVFQGKNSLIGYDLSLRCISDPESREKRNYDLSFFEQALKKEPQISEAQFASVIVERDEKHEKWNYNISPREDKGSVAVTSTANTPSTPISLSVAGVGTFEFTNLPHPDYLAQLLRALGN